MDITLFIIESWKAVELFNSGKTSAKPWEQLEVLKGQIEPDQFNKGIADGVRNVISAIKKMFKRDLYKELYFLKADITKCSSYRLKAFRYTLIAYVYGALNQADNSKAAAGQAKAIIERGLIVESRTRALCGAILNLATGLRSYNYQQMDFEAHFNRALAAAKVIDPWMCSSGVIDYPYKVSWMANHQMRTMALAQYLKSNDETLLTNYKSYLTNNLKDRGGIPEIGPTSIISSDLAGSQQAADAAYFQITTNFLKSKEKMEEARLAFINEPSLLGASTNPLKKSSLFYVLRRWNSFTPIVPDLEQRSKIYRGGGYFIWHGGKGTVVDPGFFFIRNFADAGGRVADIDNIVITHAHNDHTADLESVFTLLYRHNNTINDTIKQAQAYLCGLQVAYLNDLRTNPDNDADARFEFLCGLRPATGAEVVLGSPQDDWAKLKTLLEKNNVAPGLAPTTQPVEAPADPLDQTIMCLCLPQGSAPLIPPSLGGTQFSPTTVKKVLEIAGHALKQVTVYVNFGTMRKFEAIIDPDSQYIDYIKDVFVIHPGQTHQLVAEDKDHHNGLQMIVHKAYHNEVVAKNYATGLEFVFTHLEPNEGGDKRILITSDTSLCWSFDTDKTDTTPPAEATKPDYTLRQNLQYCAKEVTAGYPKPTANRVDVLVPHIGSIKDSELWPPSFNPKDFIYGNHLGLIGTCQVITTVMPRVALITEFGEEMTNIIELSVQAVINGAKAIKRLRLGTGVAEYSTNIVPADIGLVYDLNKDRFFTAVTWGTGEPVTVSPLETDGGIPPENLGATCKDNKTFPVAYSQV